MMVITSPRLSGFVLAAIPIIVLPLYAFGRAVRRRSRSAQDTLAEASAYAAELIGAIRTLQAFTNERLATARFGAAVERAFNAACKSARARAILTAFAIFLVAASVVVVLWIGAQDVLTAAHHARPPEPVRALRRVRGRRARIAVGDRRRGGAGFGRRRATVRNPRDRARDHAAEPPDPAAVAAARRSRVRGRALRLSDAGQCAGARRRVVFREARREDRDRRPVRRRQEHDLRPAAAVLRSDRGQREVRRRQPRRRRSGRIARAYRVGAAGRRRVRDDAARQHPFRPAGRRPTPRSSARRSLHAPPSSSRNCRKGSTPMSASAA